MSKKQIDTAIKHPTWKHALDVLREKGLAYGQTITCKELASLMRCTPESPQFAFGMISLRHAIEHEDGYYMRSIDSGAAFRIVAAEEHENVAETFDSKVRRFAVRSINIRSATLMNPNANLTDATRARMESQLEKASIRLALISRAGSVVKGLGDKAQKLLTP